MCHTLLVSALPQTPEHAQGWGSPVAATMRLVTDRDNRRRMAWLGAFLAWLANGVREAGLIIAGAAAFTIAAFHLHVIAGWAVLGLVLWLLDWSRRKAGP